VSLEVKGSPINLLGIAASGKAGPETPPGLVRRKPRVCNSTNVNSESSRMGVSCWVSPSYTGDRRLSTQTPPETIQRPRHVRREIAFTSKRAPERKSRRWWGGPVRSRWRRIRRE